MSQNATPKSEQSTDTESGDGTIDALFQTQRSESQNIETSSVNELIMNATFLKLPKQLSLVNDSTLIDDSITSKRNGPRSSYPNQVERSLLTPKRNVFISFVKSLFRPSSHPNLLSFESLTKIRCFGEILIRLSDPYVNKAEWLKCRGYKSPLHLLLLYRPPLSVVNTVILELKELGEDCPEAVCDSKGRNSLHIACATVPSNNISVIARLVNGQSIRNNVNPASIVDHQKMIPLHHVCKGKIAKTDLENRVLIIRFLTEYFPSGVLSRNNRGMTPSDLVSQTSNNPEILMILFQTIVDQRKIVSANTFATGRVMNKNTYDNGVYNSCDKHNVPNHDLIQKYTKSEHRRDGLAAFVQNNPIPINDDKNDSSYTMNRDDISEMESMYTLGYINNDTTETRNEDSQTSTTGKSPISDDIDSTTVSENDVPSNDDVILDRDYKFVNEDSESNSEDSVIRYLDLPEAFPKVSKLDSEQDIYDTIDKTTQYSNSETNHDFDTTESLTENENKLFHFDDVSISDIHEEQTVILSNKSENYTKNDGITRPSYHKTTRTSNQKKMVQFNDHIVEVGSTVVYTLIDLDEELETYNRTDKGNIDKKMEDISEETDPTESETSTSNNPFDDDDDSDRGDSTNSNKSLMMKRYGHNKRYNECCVKEVKTVLQQQLPTIHMKSDALYFL
jgi:hypothetical protein